MSIVLIDANQEYDITLDGVTFTCRPVTAREMARYNDMAATFQEDGTVRTRLNERNYEIVKNHVVRADGLVDRAGKKVPWRDGVVDRLPMDTVNELAVKILALNRLDGDDIKN